MRWTITSLCWMVLVLLPVQIAAQATGRITGRVSDAGGRPIAGATIAVDGGAPSAVTGTNGEYAIGGVGAGSRRVRVTALNHTPVERVVTVGAGQGVTANFQLAAQAVELEGLVAIGYGTARRRDVTGSIASVGEEAVKDVPTSNVGEALQGKIPGLDITRSSGSASSGVNLRLRGTRSLTASNNPLVIVDGSQFGSLSDLNVDDIETIDVLKDASSTAIYGSRGANGVILVTTKRGSAGRAGWAVNSYYGFTELASYPRINTGPEFADQKREAYRKNGLWKGPQDDVKIFAPAEVDMIASGSWTDFRELLFRNGLTQSHQVGASVGSEDTRAYLSAGVYNEAGIVRLDELTRYTLRINGDHRINDSWRVGTNSQITYFDIDNRRDPFNMANKITPLTPAFDAEGNVIVWPAGGRDISPLADEQPNVYMDNTLRSRANPMLYTEFTPLEGLRLRSTVDINLFSEREGTYRAPATIDLAGGASRATYETANRRNYRFENVLTYEREVGDHSVTLTGISDYVAGYNDNVSAQARNQLLNTQFFYALANAPDGVTLSSGYSESSLLSYAGRVHYGLKDRYLLTLTGRWDGSSRLSPGNKWAFFPAVGAAWRMIDEPFMANQSLFDDLTLRLTWGISGNDAVDPYSTQAALIKIPFAYDERPAPGFAFGPRTANPDLSWELSTMTNLRLDMGLLGNRVSAALDVYQTKTSDLLLERTLPLSSGVSSVVQNIGRTQNEGIELALTTQNVRSRDFGWETNLTFATNREKIVSLVDGTDDIGNGWFIGYPAQVFYDYEKLGIWQLGEEAEAAKFGQKPGEVRVRDQNGDGKIAPADDRVVLGSPRPTWYGGLTNTFDFWNFNLSALLFARAGGMMNYEGYRTFKIGGGENGSKVDYWTPDNPTNAFPRPDSKGSLLYSSSYFYAPAGYVKLRDVTLGFTVPSGLSNRLRLDRARLYASGKNLLTWAEVDDYDPERGGGLSAPMTRFFVLGLDVGF